MPKSYVTDVDEKLYFQIFFALDFTADINRNCSKIYFKFYLGDDILSPPGKT